MLVENYKSERQVVLRPQRKRMYARSLTDDHDMYTVIRAVLMDVELELHLTHKQQFNCRASRLRLH